MYIYVFLSHFYLPIEEENPSGRSNMELIYIYVLDKQYELLGSIPTYILYNIF